MIMVKSAKVLLLDFGFTLVDTEEGIVESLIWACQTLGFSFSSWEEEVSKVVSPLLRSGGSIRPVVDQLFDARGNRLSGEQLDSVCACYDEYLLEDGYRRFVLYEGFAEILKTLTDLGYSIVLISSMGQELVERALNELGVTWAFTRVVAAAPSAPSKDDSRFFERIVPIFIELEMRFNPFFCAVVGNSYADVRVARTDLTPFRYPRRMRNLHAAWGNSVRNGYCEACADAVVRYVSDLPDAIALVFCQGYR